MAKIDFNRLALILGVVLIAAIAAGSNYRFEITASSLRFEKNLDPADLQAVPPALPNEDATH